MVASTARAVLYGRSACCLKRLSLRVRAIDPTVPFLPAGMMKPSFGPLTESCISSPFCRYHSVVTGLPLSRVELVLDTCTSFHMSPSLTMAAWWRETVTKLSSKRT